MWGSQRAVNGRDETCSDLWRFWFYFIRFTTHRIRPINSGAPTFHIHPYPNTPILTGLSFLLTKHPWTPKPWNIKVLHPQNMGYNPPKWRFWVPMAPWFFRACKWGFFIHHHIPSPRQTPTNFTNPHAEARSMTPAYRVPRPCRLWSRPCSLNNGGSKPSWDFV